VSDEERSERAIEMVPANRSPRTEVAGLSREERRMVRLAQLLRGSSGGAMDPGDGGGAIPLHRPGAESRKASVR
jgi:hypothetical protein